MIVIVERSLQRLTIHDSVMTEENDAGLLL